MKKLLAQLLAAIMVMAIFVGCSSKTAETPSTDTPAADTPAADTPAATTDAPADVETPEGKTVKIGFIGWGYTDGLGSAYQRYLDYVAPYVGMEIVYGQYKTADDMISLSDSLSQAGCYVILTTFASASLIVLCAKNEVYMAQWGSPVLDEELKAYLEQSPYWVGCSTVDDEASGAAMVDALYEAGSRHIAVLAPAAGNACHDARYKGIYDEVAKYDDMEVVSEFRDASLNTTAPAAIQNMIAMYPELDGIVCTGASNGVMEAVIQTLATEGKTGTIKFATLDVQDGTGEYMDEGALDFIGGGQYPEVVFLALCCVNAVDGTIDLPIQIDSQFINIEGSQGYADYVKYIDAEGVFPWTAEELAQFVTRVNPDATFQDLYDTWKGYSMESVIARKEG